MNNMKKILFILSLILLISCGTSIKETQSKNEQPQTTIIKSDNIQYNINWGNNEVDIRIITLTKDGESHDYVVATSYVYKSGGLDIDHWPGCKCKSNNIK